MLALCGQNCPMSNIVNILWKGKYPLVGRGRVCIMDLFEMFGMSGDDFFGTAETKKKEKKAEKKPEKKDGKSTAATKAKGFKVKLPVTVKARGFEVTVEGDGEITSQQLCEKLYELGYEEMRIRGITMALASNGIVYLCDTGVLASAKDKAVFELPSESEETEDEGEGTEDTEDTEETEETLKVVLVSGMRKIEFTPDMFLKDPAEVSVADLTEKTAELWPDSKGCDVCVVDGYAYLLSGNVRDQVLPAGTAIHIGERIEVLEDEVETAKVGEKYLGNLADGTKARVVKVGNDYYLTYSAGGKASTYSTFETAAAGKAEKKAVVKYPLPLTIYSSLFGVSYPATSDDFGGKEKVTEEDVKNFLKPRIPALFSSDHKVAFFYSEEQHMLSCSIVSGKKGSLADKYFLQDAEEMYDKPWHIGEYQLVRSWDELKEIRKLSDGVSRFFAECDYGLSRRGVSFTILPLRTGNFYKFTNNRVEYERKIPKIPISMLRDVVEEFQKDLAREAIVRFYYDFSTGQFTAYVGQGVANKCYIEYNFEEAFRKEATNVNSVWVMDIHSHNTMPAFWSGVDDRDESAYPGVWGVIGNLDRKTPSMRFRAGFDGGFKDLEVRSIFI